MCVCIVTETKEMGNAQARRSVVSEEDMRAGMNEVDAWNRRKNYISSNKFAETMAGNARRYRDVFGSEDLDGVALPNEQVRMRHYQETGQVEKYLAMSDFIFYRALPLRDMGVYTRRDVLRLLRGHIGAIQVSMRDM